MFPTLSGPNKCPGQNKRGAEAFWLSFWLAASVVGIFNGSGTAAGQTIQPPTSVIEQLGPAGLRTFRWDFSRTSDLNFDRWPDQFERENKTGFPEYVAIDIQPRDPVLEASILKFDTAMVLQWPSIQEALRKIPIIPELPPLPPSLADYVVDRCLEVRLDGGQARITTPPLPTSSTYQYRFSIDIKTDRLVHDRVFAEVRFVDSEGNELRSARTPIVTQTRGWQTVKIEKLLPPMGAVSMKVELNILGDNDGLEDIRGSVAFDNIMFRQFPQMKITTDRKFGVYRVNDSITTTTRLLGLPEETADIRLKLIDHEGRELQTTRRQLTEGVSMGDFDQADQTANAPAPANANDPTTRPAKEMGPELPPSALDNGAKFHWTLQDLPPGFYRVTAAMENKSGVSLANQTSFVVIDRLTDDEREWSPDAPKDKNNESDFATSSLYGEVNLGFEPLPFGWSLPSSLLRQHEDGEVTDKTIAHWLREVGVGWVKMPVWFLPDATKAADAAANLAFRMRDYGIEPVGVLDEPPVETREMYRLRERGETGAAAYFHDPVVWRPQLDTIMNRMTFRFRKWQLGHDHDFSFQSRSDLVSKINEIGRELQGFGQPLEVTIPWSWMDLPPDVAGESWAGIHRDVQQPLTADELDAMLDREAEAQPRRESEVWTSLDPLPKGQYDRDARITDLVLRMATVRGHRINAAFATAPLSPAHSLVASDGHPEELLLPWRTTSLLLGRTRNLGSLRLRHDSMNIVFRGSHSSVLLIWANTPRTERLFLGDNVYQVDVWGRQAPVPTEQVDGRTVHRIDVDALPKFIVGIDPALAEFRMSVTVDEKRIDALLGREQSITVRYANPIGQALNGTIRLKTPTQWRVTPDSQPWDLNPNEASRSEFAIVLGNNATIGQFELPIDFSFATSPPTEIRVYRELDVGPEGFDLVVTTRLLNGRLLVKVQMTNNTNRAANFDCLLFAGSDRQYERRILVVPPGETIDRNVEWENGGDLVGKRMLLRATEQDGDRLINHTFDVIP